MQVFLSYLASRPVICADVWIRYRDYGLSGCVMALSQQRLLMPGLVVQDVRLIFCGCPRVAVTYIYKITAVGQ